MLIGLLSTGVSPVKRLDKIRVFTHNNPIGRLLVLVGIIRICATNGQLIAYEGAAEVFLPLFGSSTSTEPINPSLVRNAGFSVDGGITWTPSSKLMSFENLNNSDAARCSTSRLPLIDSVDETIQYRWSYNRSIQRSTDQGNTWKTIYAVGNNKYSVHEHLRVHRKVEQPYEQRQLSVPQQSFIDQKTGNLLFTMGWDGILVLTPDNQWHWVTVGVYGRESLDAQVAKNVLLWKLWAGAAFAALMMVHAWARTHPHKIGCADNIMIGISWLLWLATVFIALPVWHFNADGRIAAVPLLLLIFLCFVFFPAINDLLKNPCGFLPPVVLVAAGGYAAYLFPYGLWAIGHIPEYSSVYVFMIILTVSVGVGGQIYLMTVLPFGEDGKKKKLSENPMTEESPFMDEDNP